MRVTDEPHLRAFWYPMGFADEIDQPIQRRLLGVDLVFLNGHGGNNAVLSAVARDLHVEFRLLTYVIHPFLAYVGTSTIDPLDFHAGHSETSVVMHLAPELVHPDRATANMPESPGRHVGLAGTVDMGWTSREFGDGSGTIGDPTAATEADGTEIMDRMVRYAAECIDEIATHTATRRPPDR